MILKNGLKQISSFPTNGNVNKHQQNRNWPAHLSSSSLSHHHPSPCPQHIRCIWKDFSLRHVPMLRYQTGLGDTWTSFEKLFWLQAAWVAVAPATWALHPALFSLAIAIVSRFLSRGFYCFYQKKFGKDDGQHFSMCQLWLFAVCVSSKSGKGYFLRKPIVIRAYKNWIYSLNLYQGLILWVYGRERW